MLEMTGICPPATVRGRKNTINSRFCDWEVKVTGLEVLRVRNDRNMSASYREG